MKFENILGVPDFEAEELCERRSDRCLLIPVINEGERLLRELSRAQKAGVGQLCDIIILDGGSVDGSVKREVLEPLGVNSVLVKRGAGRQGAQLRMGFWWALRRGYESFVTIDGNDKDSIESIPLFLEKLSDGYDFVQGSRFIEGGIEENTPCSRLIAVRLIHAPLISLAARHHFTDTTNAFRAYS
ncbi:MAG: glycosyltransferase family 2 protein, partial [Oscillospiraceae bacterium]